MGTRKKRERQQGLWIASGELAQPAANVFYDRLNEILDQHNFDRQVERICRRYYRPQFGRPSIPPGILITAGSLCVLWLLGVLVAMVLDRS